jgi:hypothetical protein
MIPCLAPIDKALQSEVGVMPKEIPEALFRARQAKEGGE